MTLLFGMVTFNPNVRKRVSTYVKKCGIVTFSTQKDGLRAEILLMLGDVFLNIVMLMCILISQLKFKCLSFIICGAVISKTICSYISG